MKLSQKINMKYETQPKPYKENETATCEEAIEIALWSIQRNREKRWIFPINIHDQ